MTQPQLAVHRPWAIATPICTTRVQIRTCTSRTPPGTVAAGCCCCCCFAFLSYTADNAGDFDSCGHRRCWRAAASCSYNSRRRHAKSGRDCSALCVLFSYSLLLCALLCGRSWQSSVFRLMISFWIFSAIQQQTPQANATATGTVAAGQQRPRAPTTPAGTAASR